MKQLKLESQPHKRYNPLTGEWVLVSPHRNRRPWQGQTENPVPPEQVAYDAECYLCPGNSRSGGKTNPEYSSTFVFTNDFAALLNEGKAREVKEGLLNVQEETGICRVVCFSPNHSLTLPEMQPANLVTVVRTWQSEFAELSAIPHIKHIQIFENKGAIMGCSNPHPHGQIWAQSTIPNEAVKRTANQQQYFAKNGRSLLHDYLLQEIDLCERIVCENEDFVCLVPFWAVWPFETIIIPRRAFAAVTDMTGQETQHFAAIIQEITTRYDNLFNTSFPYSAGMQQRPTDGKPYRGWHFHYSFYPPLLRSATVKKFMVGYELFAMPQRDITPEQAAKLLRKCSTVHYRK